MSRHILFMICILFSSLNLFAQGGGVISGGGDSFSAEFVKIAYDLHSMLVKKPIPEINNDHLLKAIRTTKVNSDYVVILNGVEVDAINTPSLKHILINRRRWLDTSVDLKRRIVLVAHEYLGIMEIDDKNYQISNSLFLSPGSTLRTYTCGIPSSIDLYTLEVSIYRKNIVLSTVKMDGEVMPLEHFISFLPTDVELETLAVSMNVIITVNFPGSVHIFDLPLETFGKPIPEGSFTGDMIVYPGENSKINCTHVNYNK